MVICSTYSGRKYIMRTASKQKALAHTAIIKLHIKFRLLFSYKQFHKIKIGYTNNGRISFGAKNAEKRLTTGINSSGTPWL